jgi:hypothetical protein
METIVIYAEVKVVAKKWGGRLEWRGAKMMASVEGELINCAKCEILWENET